MSADRKRVKYEYRDDSSETFRSSLAVPETAFVPSHSDGMFRFMWRRSLGGTSIISKVGNFLIPAGSLMSGYDLFKGPAFIDPVQQEHKLGPWIGDSLYTWEWYEPFSTPSLHRKFARLSSSHAAIRRFSSRYGLLGHGAFLLSPDDGGWSENELVGNCKIEAVHYWHREIATMRRLIEIWDHAEKGDVSELDPFVKWTVKIGRQDRPWNQVRWKEPSPELDSRGLAIKIMPFLNNEILGYEGSTEVPMPNQWKWGEILEVAKFFVSHNVNKRLAGHVSPRIMPFAQADIQLWPDCLMSAMYVQFAHEISGKVGTLIECKGCGRVFEQRHASRRYCEPECRQRRYWKEKGSETAKKRKTEREASNG